MNQPVALVRRSFSDALTCYILHIYFIKDPPNRRLIWTIIRKMKEAGKCVILTTHFLEEADILSDRIAIMANGRLQASGTPNFLKQRAGLIFFCISEKNMKSFLEFEYRLFIEKTDICNTKNITRFIREYVPDVMLERETPLELVFGIKRDASQHIGRLINALDQQQQYIAINGYGLSMTTIEEVFLK
jgi:ATP-binding cassette subfamily A (ABC1) protein 3